MGNYEMIVMVFDKEITFNVRANDIEEGTRKILDKPLLEVLAELKLDDVVDSYSGTFEED